MSAGTSLDEAAAWERWSGDLWLGPWFCMAMLYDAVQDRANDINAMWCRCSSHRKRCLCSRGEVRLRWVCNEPVARWQLLCKLTSFPPAGRSWHPIELQRDRELCVAQGTTVLGVRTMLQKQIERGTSCKHCHESGHDYPTVPRSMSLAAMLMSQTPLLHHSNRPSPSSPNIHPSP